MSNACDFRLLISWVCLKKPGILIGAEEVPMTSEHHQRFPKISKECQMWLYKASNLGTTLPRLRISISWQDYRGKVSGDLAEIPQKKPDIPNGALEVPMPCEHHQRFPMISRECH